MTQILPILKLALGPFISSIFLFFPQTKTYAPQAIAFLSIITIIISLKQKRLSLLTLSYLINTIIFTTGGLNSPVFYLTHFFIFTLASFFPPTVTLSYSLIITLFLINSLDSPQSVLTLISLPLITPLAYYIAHLNQDNLKKEAQIEVDQDQISYHESGFFLWFSLTFKNKINTIIDILSRLLSNPKLDYNQKQMLNDIRHNSKTLLKTATKLAKDIDTKTDEV